MVKIKIIFVVIFITKIVSAQTIEPILLFDSYSAFDRCMGMVEKPNGEVVALHQFANFLDNPDGSIIGNVDRSTLPFMSHTLIWTYNPDGTVKSFIPIQSTDSLYYHGFYMQQLSSGKFLISGDVMQTWNEITDLFFAIVNEDGDSVEVINRIEKNPQSEFPLGIWEKNNGNILIYYTQANLSPQRESLIELDLQGNIINETYNFNSGLYDDLDYNSIFLNDVLYHFVDFNNLLVTIDENYVLYSTPNSQLYGLSEGGVKFNNSILINSFGPTIYQVFDKDSVNILYEDTSFNSNERGGRIATIDYVDSNYIYFTLSHTSDSGSLLIYSVNSLGELNWKKSIRLADNNFTSHLQGVHQAGLATKDKGYLIAFGVKDEYGYGDSYILKLDSNGNQVDAFTTGIKDRNNIQFKVSDFIVYPNPAKDLVQIESLNYKEQVFVEIYNVEGKLLLSKSFKNNTEIDINSFETGIYFYQMKTEEGILLEEGKFVKK